MTTFLSVALVEQLAAVSAQSDDCCAVTKRFWQLLAGPARQQALVILANGAPMPSDAAVFDGAIDAVVDEHPGRKAGGMDALVQGESGYVLGVAVGLLMAGGTR